MTKRALTAVAVFGLGVGFGCAAAPFVVPRASAQQAAAITRWEYLSPKGIDFDDWQGEANRAGREGWELVSLQFDHGSAYACFKRPKM